MIADEDPRLDPLATDEDEAAFYDEQRALTAADPNRRRALPRWQPSPTVDHLPCRNPDCRRPVELTEIGRERIEAFNARLRSLGEPTLDVAGILVCADCRVLLEKHRTVKLGERRDRMARAIRELVAGCIAEREIVLFAQLEKDRHPDVAGLRASLEKRKHNADGKRARKETGL